MTGLITDILAGWARALGGKHEDDDEVCGGEDDGETDLGALLVDLMRSRSIRIGS